MASSLPLDEDNECYGYGIYNVHSKAFLKQVGEYTDPHIHATPREAVRFMVDMVFNSAVVSRDNLSAYRVVRVHLDNVADKKLPRAVEQYADRAGQEQPNTEILEDVLDRLFSEQGGAQ